MVGKVKKSEENVIREVGDIWSIYGVTICDARLITLLITLKANMHAYSTLCCQMGNLDQHVRFFWSVD